MSTEAQAPPEQVRSGEVATKQAAPGWYGDPDGNGQRYWDGTRWTDHHPPAPVATPAPPGYGVVHCRGCGQPINPQAAICVHCGVATGAQPQVLPPRPKSKTTAVLLAVFLG